MPPAKGKTDLHIYLEATWAEYARKEAASLGVSVSELFAAALKHWKDPELESRGELVDLIAALRVDLARVEQSLQPAPSRRWPFSRRGHGNDER